MTEQSSKTPVRDSHAYLQQKHPDHEDRLAQWERYRAFGGGIQTNADKRVWLEPGKHELDEQYAMRIQLAEDLGLTSYVLNRFSGALTKRPPSRPAVEESSSTLSKETIELIAKWRKGVNGHRLSLDRWWHRRVPGIQRMGTQFVEVCRDPLPPEQQQARAREDHPLPYLATWSVFEAEDWDLDERSGQLNWIRFHRRVRTKAKTWSGQAQGFHDVYRILTRERGVHIEVDWGQDREDAEILEGSHEWIHGLGIVPVVVPRGLPDQEHALYGQSYVDRITIADRRALRLDADQSHASHLHGNPRLKVWSKRKFKEIISSAAHFLKLLPEEQGKAKEDAEYLQTDAAGMEIRETIIGRTHSVGLQTSGVDPTAVLAALGGNNGSGRSGVAMAYSFSASEEPLLNKAAEQLEQADTELHEIVARYLATDQEATAAGLEVMTEEIAAALEQDPETHAETIRKRAQLRLWEGSTSWSRVWDLMAPQQLVTLGQQAKALCPSPTFARRLASSVRRAIDPSASEETAQIIETELDDILQKGGFDSSLSGFDDGEDDDFEE